MADYTGCSQFFLALRCPAEWEEEGDRVFAHHVQWVERTHPREGDAALLQYTVSKRKNDDGSINFLLAETYATDAGVRNHHRLAHEDKADSRVEDLFDFAAKCDAIGWGAHEVVASLW